MWLPSHGSDAGDKHSCACVGVGVGGRGGRVGERGDDYRLYTVMLKSHVQKSHHSCQGGIGLSRVEGWSQSLSLL